MAATTKVIDMTNIKERGNFNPRHKTAGDYRAKIVKVEDHQPKDSATVNGWVFTISLASDARATYPYYANWETNQAWKTRNLCVAAGVLPPDKKAKVRIDPNKLVGKTIAVSLEDDEYEGKMKSVIQGVFPESELSEGDGPADEGTADADADDDDLDLEDI
jgi:hypothetical protein